MTERSKKMLTELDKRAQPAFIGFLSRLDAVLGDDQYIVFEGRRTPAVQSAYFAQGRQPLEEVNRLRQEAGLWLIRSQNDNRVITWTLQSKHIEGLAMDVLPVDGRGNPTWDLAHFRMQFEHIRNCGRAIGLICGADWLSPQADWPHYEIK
ncbi:MAG: M15 family metallopeptidase [Treponema sp.]|nr:M15 family metallopeptidase [Treponema sp.]